MITLTNAIQVPSAPGSGVTNAFDKVRLRNITLDPVNKTIVASVELLSSTNTALPPVSGTLSISTVGNSPQAQLSIPALDLYPPALSLAAADQNSVQSEITSVQNAAEAWLVSKSLIVGTQATGV